MTSSFYDCVSYDSVQFKKIIYFLSIQKYKIKVKNMTVLIWDLSAAFDTLDIEILCNKLTIFGYTSLTLLNGSNPFSQTDLKELELAKHCQIFLI